MRRSQHQSDMSSGDSTVREEAKQVLQASLFLSVLKHAGHRVSKGDEHALLKDVKSSSSQVHEPHDLEPRIVPCVNALIDSIGQCRGSFEKPVTESDIRDQQNRLMLTKDHVLEFVLPLLREGDDPERGVEVKTFNTKGKTYSMRFKMWCGKVYVLTSNWKAFVKENQLKVSDVLKIWAFSDVRTQELCFVISRKPKALEQSGTEKGFEAKDESPAS